MASSGSASFRAVTWAENFSGRPNRLEVAGELDLDQPAPAVVMVEGTVIGENPNILVLEVIPLTLHDNVAAQVITRQQAGYLARQEEAFEYESVAIFYKGEQVASAKVEFIVS
jgi:hypothetical protein